MDFPVTNDANNFPYIIINSLTQMSEVPFLLRL